MNIYSDERIVLTLDAGGTNFVFSAMKAGKNIVDPIGKPSNAHDLELCLQTIKDGFKEVISKLDEKPVAISFAFPGPADYLNGIIGKLTNLPAFTGGVPLGGILEEEFKLPVFINNDGDLFIYGEALGGILPEVNRKLKEAGTPRKYKNVIGLTLGTGCGFGATLNETMLLGDNSAGGEVWCKTNSVKPELNLEEAISTRAILNAYAEESGESSDGFMPFDIFKIAKGESKGNKEAALKSFEQFGTAIGDLLANLISLFDGVVVIGGGITGAKELYQPAMFKVLNGEFKNGVNRVVQQIFNLDDEQELGQFLKNQSQEISIPGTTKTVSYDPVPKIGVATSKIGASESIALGAYAFALSQL